MRTANPGAKHRSLAPGRASQLCSALSGRHALEKSLQASVSVRLDQAPVASVLDAVARHTSAIHRALESYLRTINTTRPHLWV